MLSQHGVTFEAYNVEQTPEAWRDLQRFHIPTVPAVIAGDRFVHGWNPRALSELFGWPYVERQLLPPGELLARLDIILDVAQRTLRQFPDKHLDIKTPDRERPLRQLGPHIFHVTRGFLEAMDDGTLSYARLVGEDAPAFQSMAEIVAYGDEVRARVRTWSPPAAVGFWQGTVETYYGPSGIHELLERTVWHCAQHVRQLQVLIGTLGITPERPLQPDDLRGLPLPDAVW